MRTFAFITGRNSELSLEELLVILEPLGQILEVHKQFLIFQGDIYAHKLLEQLGGTVKIAEVVKTINSTDQFTKDEWLHILRSELRNNEGKFTYGLSVYSEIETRIKQLKKIGLELKKYLKSIGNNSRFVFNNEGKLSSVAVQKNKILGKELIFLEGKKIYLSLTCEVQDFNAYSKRDYGRPSRNMERGMLPPKLAQIMLNLGRVKRDDVLLDPFCGGGTIIQEALLMGLETVYGSDNDPEAIKEAEINTNWLSENYNVAQPKYMVADIFNLSENYKPSSINVVVTEPYLGPARTLHKRSLTRRAFFDIRNNLERIYLHVFEELSHIVKNGGHVVMVFPVFKLFGEEYSIGSFEAYANKSWKLKEPYLPRYFPDCSLSDRGQVMYFREGQTVAREITVWDKI